MSEPIDAIEIREDKTPMNSNDLQEFIRQREHILQTIKEVSFKRLSSHDIIDLGGKPYLTAQGVRKMRAAFGITAKNQTCKEVTREDEKGKYTQFVYEAVFSWAASPFDEFPAIGTCDTRDPFFSKAKGRTRSIDEIDLGHVQKAAWTNCCNNGIKSLLGLELDWEELKKYGITSQGRTKVNYGETKPNQVWKWEDKNGKVIMFASEGDLLTPESLKEFGLKKSKKGSWYCPYDEEKYNQIETLVKSLPF